MPKPPIQIKNLPRTWVFELNGMSFQCPVTWRDPQGMHPKDILILELEEVLADLKAMPTFKVTEPFKLPPLKPEDLRKRGLDADIDPNK